jgi:hypoxanthine-guanine phosphoribosyltransferase
MQTTSVTTKQKILEYIDNKVQASPKELSDFLGITPRAVFRHLSTLLEADDLFKIGRPPTVYYRIKEKVVEPKKASYTASEPFAKDFVKAHNLIEKNFMLITPLGIRMEGMTAFASWCITRNFDIGKKALEYSKIITKYDKLRKNGLIDGTKKIKNTFDTVFVDEVYYLDFYSIEVFGKTKLGQKLLYAKQSQNKDLIKEISAEVRPKILALIEEKDIDGVLFVPPTVKREIQFMKELEKSLSLGVNSIKISKLRTPIQIPQKTLNKLEDRIENAKKTFVVTDSRVYKNVLIIDDAVGSGATLNEIAGLMRKQKMVKEKIIGLAITGSLKGFDVISEV